MDRSSTTTTTATRISSRNQHRWGRRGGSIRTTESSRLRRASGFQSALMPCVLLLVILPLSLSLKTCLGGGGCAAPFVTPARRKIAAVVAHRGRTGGSPRMAASRRRDHRQSPRKISPVGLKLARDDGDRDENSNNDRGGSRRDDDEEPGGLRRIGGLDEFLDAPFFDPDAVLRQAEDGEDGGGDDNRSPSSPMVWFANLVKNDYAAAEALYAGLFLALMIVVSQEMLRWQMYGGDYVPFNAGGGGSFGSW